MESQLLLFNVKGSRVSESFNVGSFPFLSRNYLNDMQGWEMTHQCYMIIRIYWQIKLFTFKLSNILSIVLFHQKLTTKPQKFARHFPFLNSPPNGKWKRKINFHFAFLKVGTEKGRERNFSQTFTFPRRHSKSNAEEKRSPKSKIFSYQIQFAAISSDIRWRRFLCVESCVFGKGCRVPSSHYKVQSMLKWSIYVADSRHSGKLNFSTNASAINQ